MKVFTYKKGKLYAEGVSVEALTKKYGTPLFIYSRTYLKHQLRTLDRALSTLNPLICFSVKTNTNAAVIKTMTDEGAGVDVVSGGELYRARRAGVPANKIVFAGVAKTIEEIEFAIKQNILFFTVESEAELERIAKCARRLKRKARIAFRVNPDVDPKTHKYISTGKKENKFGLDIKRVKEAYARAAELRSIEIAGIHMHIGSQILSSKPFAEAIKRVSVLCKELKVLYPTFKYLDIGGGLGIQYKPDDKPLSPIDFARAIKPLVQKLDMSLVMEPGRNLVGNAGIMVTEVQYLKEGPAKTFVMVDAGMNDLLRPSLYQAYHEIIPVKQTRKKIKGDVVGPICESGDFFAADRQLPSVDSGDLLAILSCGAYAYTMSSNYNSRPRAAEVMVSGNKSALVRKRETIQDLVKGECLPKW